MPIYLKDVDVVAEVAKFQSALIVPCRFCPAASLAVRNNKPFIEFFRRLLKTEPYEELIDNVKLRLEEEGLKTSVFTVNLLNYLICLWTSGGRKKLIKHASQFEAVVCHCLSEPVINHRWVFPRSRWFSHWVPTYEFSLR